MKEYAIAITINASKEVVWKMITNFKNYPNWNSVLRMSENDSLTLDHKFKVTILQPNGKKDQFEAKTIDIQEGESFSATQIMLGKWFFQAIHHFTIQEIGTAQVQFIQKWELKGIIASIFYTQIRKQLALFKIMNSELKAVLEH